MKHSVKEVKLKNGSRGLLIDVPDAEVTCMKFCFQAGDKFTRDDSVYETAHFMEHMALQANAKYTKEDMELEFTKNGAYRNAFTGDDRITYLAKCADFDTLRILDLQRDTIASPKYQPDHFISEREVIRAELTNDSNDYGEMNKTLIWNSADGRTTKRPLMTYRDRLKNLNNVTIEDLKEHHDRTHTTRNLRFIIAGNINDIEQEIIDNIENWQLRPGEFLQEPENFLAKNVEAPLLTLRADSENLILRIYYFINRRLSHYEENVIGALSHILTGGIISSRVTGHARNKGLLYHAASGIYSYGSSSYLYFYIEVNQDKAEKVIKLIVEELLDILHNGVTQAELDAAKSYGIGRQKMGGQTTLSLTKWYEDDYFDNVEIRNYNKTSELINQITLADMTTLAREFFTDKKCVFGAIGNVEQKFVDRLKAKLDKLEYK